ncbi:acyltransferase family protein [Sphingomonas paeninsulae]|nr:acyltransferase [Sphingomonas paeninsulae]
MFIFLPMVMLVVVALVLRFFPKVWDWTVRKQDASRNHTMDGARGLLSLWVLTHHLNIGPAMVLQNGGWQPLPSALQILVTSGFFVAPFFALTAMLFGGGLLASKGKLDTFAFIRRRFFRLVPAYIVSIVLIVAAVFYISGFHLRVAPLSLIKEMVRWTLFDFVQRYDINGVNASGSHGMLWTLRYEILFYASLPILAFAQRRLNSRFVLIAGLALISFFSWPFIFFTGGAVAAAALGWRHPRAATVWQIGSIISIAVLVLTASHTNAVLQAVLLVPMLAAIALQGAIFRPLSWKPIRFVGEISYSVYILHYPVIWIIFTLFISPATVQSMGFVERTLILAVGGCVVLVIATLCFVFVERPFVAYSKRSGGKAGAGKVVATSPALTVAGEAA